MNHIDFSLPLQNPVLIFSIVLFIILFAPILLSKLRIPPIIGLIIAGAVIGPNGLNLLQRDSSIVLFGTVGLLYIMFLAGLEIDMADFKKNKYKSMLFGFFTFSIPMLLGWLVGYYLMELSLNSAILLASMFASHTLLAYPIVSRFGVIKNKAVNITVGGTVITDTLALLVLAVIIGMERGEVGQEFWLRLSGSLLVFGSIVLVGIPLVSRWFFKKQQDAVAQYIYVLGVVFFSAFMAELAGVEAIIGAFLAGLALNRIIPHTSALMNRIEFVGNALFIPFFLIGVGMLIDFEIFISGSDALLIAGLMTLTATLAKFLAAYLSKLSFRFSRSEFLMMFGLSNAQAAATLAAVLIAYNVITGVSPEGEPIRLLNEDVLNGTIVMILITCTISSLVVNKAAREIALVEGEEEHETGPRFKVNNRFLIPVSNAETIEHLISFTALFKQKKAPTDFFALNIQTEEENSSKGKKLLEKAQKAGAAADTTVRAISRFDINIASGILNSIKENRITDVVLGMHQKGSFTDTHFGQLLENVINGTGNTLFIYKPVQPINTIKKMVVVVPEKAEYEPGFSKVLNRLHLLSKELSAPMLIYTNPLTRDKIKKGMEAVQHNLPLHFHALEEWEDFLIISRDLRQDDLLVVLNARKDTLSYNKLFDKLPRQLSKYFEGHNVLMVYPEQYR
ncbi:cation:proton antiporter [Nafulsella turpanensis]|uniref:cation:proton antiporter n=1 Tax=Nafulsella turpanensis TaxID=1265690 RepID=UPI000345ED54|nr:cation:proton antiporter [Nafulsella turpanensis]